MILSLNVDQEHRILEAKFRAVGCSAMVAAASFLTSKIEGELTGEAATLAQHPELLTDQIGPTPPGWEHCAKLACEALLSAIADYSNSIRDEWIGEEALVCTCFGVSERVIENQIRVGSLISIEEVTQACNAGAGCRSCYPLIQDILDEVKRK